MFRCATTDHYLPFAVPGFGLLVALIMITLIGFLTANFIGKAIVSYGERLLNRLPMVRGIYKALKQIFETVLSNKSEMFSKVGLVEYPRKDVWSLVFVAGEKDTEINAALDRPGDPLIGVFMPCAQPDNRLYVCLSLRDRHAGYDDRGRRETHRLRRPRRAGIRAQGDDHRRQVGRSGAEQSGDDGHGKKA
jgi:hypothetical protein